MSISLSVKFVDKRVSRDYIDSQAECYRSVELNLVIGSTPFK